MIHPLTWSIKDFHIKYATLSLMVVQYFLEFVVWYREMYSTYHIGKQSTIQGMCFNNYSPTLLMVIATKPTDDHNKIGF
jgi:hypothetical protein